MNNYISSCHVVSHHPGEYISHGLGRAISLDTVRASAILDPRVFPTVKVDLELDDGTIPTGSAPAGASTGRHEAVELRDGGSAFGGKGVERALRGIRDEITPLLLNRSWPSISEVDRALSDLDGTGTFARLGTNAVLAVSMATARVFAANEELPLHRWICHVTGRAERLPVPYFAPLNGGAHASNALDFQEFVIVPLIATTEAETVRIGANVPHALKKIVNTIHGPAGLGDEGDFAPPVASAEAALDLPVEAIQAAGYPRC